MTQAEKAQLRYIALMEQIPQVQGDMGATLQTSANALRVLQNQFKILGREIGNIFIPMLQKIIPIAIAVTKVLGLIAKAIAGLFGFKLPEIDWSGATQSTGTVAEDLDEANGSAKALKRQLAGFDELNNLTSPSSGSSGSGTVSGGDFDIELPEYDMLSRLNKDVEDLQEKVMKFLGLTQDETGKLSWSFKDMDDKAKILLGTLGLIAGIRLFTGVANGIKTIMEAISTFKKLGSVLSGLKLGTKLKTALGLGEVEGGISAIFGALKTKALEVAPMLSEALLPLAGLAAVVVTFIYAWKNDEEFREKVKSLGDSFANVFNAVKEGFENLWSILKPILEPIQKVWEEAIKPALEWILKTIAKIGYEIIKLGILNFIEQITGALNTLAAIMRGDFKGAWDSVTTSITNQFENIKKTLGNLGIDIDSIGNKIKTKAKDVFDNVGNWFGNKADWIKNKFKEVRDFFSNKLTEFSNEVEQLPSKIFNFFYTLPSRILDLFEKIKNGIVNKFNEVINWLGQHFKLPELQIPRLPKIGLSITFTDDGGWGAKAAKAIGLQGYPHFDFYTYATGGFPDSGQFFMARENGIPEMVGQIGSRTAVANNDQIVDAIKGGVYEAVMNANSSNGNNDNYFNVNIGNSKVYSGIARSIRNENNRYGVSVI